MPIPSLALKDTDAEPGKLWSAALDFEDLGGRITGTGNDLHGSIRSGATEFSELIAEPIRGLADKNKGAWTKAVQGATWGAAVTSAWSGNVTEFRERRRELETRWAVAVGSDFGVTMDQTQPGMAEVKAAERFNKEVDAAAAKEHAAIMADFAKIWKKLEDDAADRSNELKAGPEKATLATLMDTGALGWAGFNLWGKESPTPLDGEDGRKLADRINAALKRGELPSAADMANFNALLAHAAYLQQTGGKLSAGEIDFLRSLYNGLDKKSGGSDLSNLVDPAWYNSPGLDPAAVEAFKAGIGNGLLALSDEELGGGMDLMPVSIQEILNDQEGEADRFSEGNWLLGLSGLAGVMTATGGKYAVEKLKGGAEFSALTTLRLADNADEIPDSDNKLARGLLEVAFRNDKGAADILLGKHDDDTRYGKNTAEYAMRELWGKDWGDDGKTAAGFINWIPDAMDGKDPEMRDLAVKSAYEVYTTMTSTEKTAWKQSAFEWITDGFGKAGSDPAAPMAVRNPYVTNAFGDLIGHDLDDVFGAEAKDVKNQLADGKISLDWDTRERLFQIAMADEKTADNLGKAIYARVIADAGGAENWSPGEGLAYGSKNGTLTRLLDGGLARLAGDTGSGLNEAAADKQATANDQRITRWGNMGAAVLKEAVLALPVVDDASDLVKVGTKVLFELGKTGPGAASSEGWWETRPPGGTTGGGGGLPDYSTVQGEIIRSAVDGSGVSHDDLRKSIANLDDEVRKGLEFDDIVGRDGQMRSWDLIDPQHRRAASAVFYDTLSEAEREALSKYSETITGERLWEK